MNHPRPDGLPEWADPLNNSPLPLKLRLEDFLVLEAAGAFEEYNRTELIDGEIIYMNAQHRPHLRVKSELGYRLRDAIRRAGVALTVFVEASVAIPPKDLPEPDVLLTSEPEGDGFVPVASVALVVEVADTTLRFDLGRKRERYAAAGIPEYWVVDIAGRTIHQMWSPNGQDFAERREIPFGDPIAAATIAPLTVATDGLG